MEIKKEIKKHENCTHYIDLTPKYAISKIKNLTK